jgi:hypothetical protein
MHEGEDENRKKVTKKNTKKEEASDVSSGHFIDQDA